MDSIPLKNQLNIQKINPTPPIIFAAESIVLTGIIPTLLTDILKYCCPFSEVTFGELYNSTKQAEDSYDEGIHMDFTFLVYGLQGLATTKYKDNPFIPLVQAPRMVLLVPEALFENKNTRTKVLLQTFLNSWPMLLFISLSACLSGLVVWFLVSIRYSIYLST